MKRRNFIKASAGITAMATLSSLKSIADSLPETGQKMPVLFVGHGSPMNAIENNEFTQKWQKIAKNIPKPVAVLCISAHWLTRGTFVTAAPQLETHARAP